MKNEIIILLYSLFMKEVKLSVYKSYRLNLKRLPTAKIDLSIPVDSMSIID